MDVRVDQQGSTTIVAPDGDIDLNVSRDLQTRLRGVFSNRPSRVVVDLEDVPYMDSSGVATLVEGLRSAKDKDLAFVILMPSEPVIKVLQLSRLDSVFEIRGA